MPDPVSNKKEQGKNKLVVLLFLAENYLSFWTGTDKYLSPLTQNKVFLTQKIVTKLSEIWVGSGIWEKTYPGSRGQKRTGFRIRNSGTNQSVNKNSFSRRLFEQEKINFDALDYFFVFRNREILYMDSWSSLKLNF
jgi:hypothetical protein